jgi:hypothetical protein
MKDATIHTFVGQYEDQCGTQFIVELGGELYWRSFSTKKIIFRQVSLAPLVDTDNAVLADVLNGEEKKNILLQRKVVVQKFVDDD